MALEAVRAVEAMVETLRLWLKSRNLSFHKVHRRASELARGQGSDGETKKIGSRIRHKLGVGKESQFLMAEVLLVLEAAGIDRTEFFARLANRGELDLAVLGPRKKGEWTKEQKRILTRIDKIKERGSRGYAEARAELLRIELLRDENPNLAEAEAWAFLDRHESPGALVGALAILAVEAPRDNVKRLLDLAFQLLGSDRRNAAAAKLLTATGRSLYLAGHYHVAQNVLEDYALKVVGRHGSRDELALVNYYIGISASKIGDLATSRSALEQCFSLGSERWQFAALQHLALEELNGGDVGRAADMYDQLVAMPFFSRAERRAVAFVTWSRLTSHFLSGNLGPSAEPEFRRAVAEARILDPGSQVSAVLDLTLFLRSHGKVREACDVLKAERWNVLDLEDAEIKRKFAEQWDALGITDSLWGLQAVSPKEAKSPQPRRPGSPRGRGPIRAGRAASPKV